MSFLELNIANEPELTQRQRWSIYLCYIAIAFCFYIGFSLRETSLNQTTLYTNVEAGITALYPERWLLDESGDYVLRVRDMSNRGFKTVMEVSTLPVTSDTVERNLLDRLSLNRSQTFIDYSILGYTDYLLPDETPAIAMSYTFVSRDASPFLEGVSTVVVGLDILTIQRGQALIITFRADSNTYEQELSTFEQFIQDIDY